MEGLYYPHSENKGAHQLRGDREADLRLFSHMQKAVFLTTRLNIIVKLWFTWLYVMFLLVVFNLNGAVLTGKNTIYVLCRKRKISQIFICV